MKAIVMIAILGVATVPASGTIINGPEFGFECITNNSGSCSTTIAPMFLLTLYEDDSVTGVVYFKFQNLGPIQSTITALYWDDHPLGLLADMQIGTSYGIASFQIGGTPAAPPGGAGLSPPWKHDETSFVATNVTRRGNGVQSGIDPGEYQIIQFTVRTDLSPYPLVTDPMEIVATALFLGDLRVAIHVQSIGEYSESLILVGLPHDVPDVPEPGSALLLLGGTAILLAAKRRRARKN